MANRIGNTSPSHLGDAQDDRNDSDLGREAGKTTRATQGTREHWGKDLSLSPYWADSDEAGTPSDKSPKRVPSSEPILRGSDRGRSVRHANDVSRKSPSLEAPVPDYPQKTVSIRLRKLLRSRPSNCFVGISGKEPGRLSKIEGSSDEESSGDEPFTSQNKGDEDTREFGIFGMEL